MPIGEVLPEMVRRRAEESPTRVFLREVDGPALTWAELHRGTTTWVAALKAAGVKSGDAVATMMAHGVEAYFAWLACGWLGAIEVPANLAYKARWLQHVLNLPRARFLVISERYLDRLADVWEDLFWLDTVIVFDAQDALPELPFRTLDRKEFLSGAPPRADERLVAPAPHDISCIIYTSGTSGPTKGVLVTWAMLHDAVESAVPATWGEGDVWYGTAPLYHVSGKSSLLVGAHYNSGLVVRETYSTGAFWEDIRNYGCTGAALVGAMVNYLFRQPPHGRDADSPLRYVRMTPLIEELEEFRRRFGVEVYTAYGMTEITPPISFASEEVDAGHWKSCGRVRPGLDVRVVDDFDRPLPPGEVGALVVRSHEPWLITPGYVNMPEETAKAWQNGWFHTNDAFTYDEDGYFYFQPGVKKKDMIRRRGENISAFEVEVAVRQHPDVADCKAMAVASEWGEDEVKVVVVAKPGRTIEPRQLIDFLDPFMPRFALPRFVELASSLSGHATGSGATLRAHSRAARVWDREQPA
jgi:crotonobetaine/carnitine-CoA ligase